MARVGRPKKSKTTVIYVRIPKTLQAKLRRRAKQEHREVSATIGLILESHFETKTEPVDTVQTALDNASEERIQTFS